MNVDSSPGAFFECGTVTAVNGSTVSLVRGQNSADISFESRPDELAQVRVGEEISVKVRRTRDGLMALGLDREFE